VRARDNPFRAERVEALAYRAPGFSWPELLARLRAQGGRGAIRGPQGSGKTTLLHELGDRLAQSGLEVRRLRPDLDDRRRARRQVSDFSRGAGEATALLLDGADRLGPLTWSLFVREAATVAMLVVTTHRESRLPTLHRCSTSPALLADLVGELMPIGQPPRVSVRRLLRRQHGDIRKALRELYDRHASD
jgi:hypothetical protein